MNECDEARSLLDVKPLLATIGVAGPFPLTDRGCAASDGGGTFMRSVDSDDLDVRCLETSDAAVPLLNDECLLALLEGTFGTRELLLSRFDWLRTGAGAPWRRAVSLRSRAVAERSFLPGVTLLVALGMSSVDVELSSHRLEGFAGDSADLKRTYELRPWEAVVLANRTRYRPSMGEWFSVVFVRGWIKPDVMFCEALTATTQRALTDCARAWTGFGRVPPRDCPALFEAEAAAITEGARSQYGRGI